SVRQLALGARRAYGQTHLALFSGASRSLGVSLAAGYEAANHPTDWLADSRRREADPQELHVRLLKRDRTPYIANPATRRAAVRRAGRAWVADEAVPDKAGTVRSPDVRRERHQPVSASGGAGRAPSALHVASQ